MNRHIGTVIVAPMPTQGREYPTRIPVRFQRNKGQIVLDRFERDFPRRESHAHIPESGGALGWVRFSEPSVAVERLERPCPYFPSIMGVSFVKD
jgi:hypothetical protein